MKKIVLDFRKANNISKAHKIIKEELSFPDYYGKNLDALNDCLSEIEKNIYIYIITKKERFEGFNDIIKVFKDNKIKYEIIISGRLS